MAYDAVEQRNLPEDAPGQAVVAVTSGVTFALCRCLNVQNAGTADIVDAHGVTTTGYYLQQGYNPISVSKVTFSGGSPASGVWAVY